MQRKTRRIKKISSKLKKIKNKNQKELDKHKIFKKSLKTRALFKFQKNCKKDLTKIKNPSII